MTDESDKPIDPKAGGSAPAGLAEIRTRIDALDREIHDRLIERSSIIDSLIKVKRADHTGVAFRPRREADMMYRFAERHHGSLPLTTVEHMWREIISTFTYLQAPYGIHLDTGIGVAPAYDSLRFYFGFSVPHTDQPDAASAISAVAASRSDLGYVGLGEAASPWWTALTDPAGPRIIARTPFFEMDGRAAATPMVVVSNPLDEQSDPDRLCWATDWSDDADIAEGFAALEIEILATHSANGRTDALIAAPKTLEPDTIADLLADAGSETGLRPAGGYSSPMRIETDKE